LPTRHPSALAVKTNTLDAAKIEHGRREDPFVQFRPQGGDQSSLHPDSCCRDAAKIEKSVVVLKEETRGGRHVGWDVGGAAGSPCRFAAKMKQGLPVFIVGTV
jgi:hypothetical protein